MNEWMVLDRKLRGEGMACDLVSEIFSSSNKSLHISTWMSLCSPLAESFDWYDISSCIFAAGPDGHSSIKFHKNNLALSALFICSEEEDKD